MTGRSPILMWFRRDLRLSDHPALAAAVATGRPVIPVFIRDEVVESHGAAPKWRLGLGVAEFARQLEAMGSRLILRRGPALEVLNALVAETGAGAVYWSRLYDPASKARDTGVKSALKDAGVEAQSFHGHLLFEPWTVATKTGGFYKVYTPFWNMVKTREVPAPLAAPAALPGPDHWPESDDLERWQMGRAMDRGAAIVARHVHVGELAAQDRLALFLDERVGSYVRNRDLPSVRGTSGLSENLTYGEISPRTAWHGGQRALLGGDRDAEVFLKELVWREFAYHLMHHTPHILTDNWRPEWKGFPWRGDNAQAQAWRQGRTGVAFVDAAMREMYVTGTMHNRGRMIAACYLTKHLMTDWKVGLKWFEDCLIDWDPAANAMGWQWSAGSGPDAAPYFRVFNPDTQLAKFDPSCAYVDAWIAEGRKNPSSTALDYFRATPRSWTLSAEDQYPTPIVPLDEGRARALDAYRNREF